MAAFCVSTVLDFTLHQCGSFQCIGMSHATIPGLIITGKEILFYVRGMRREELVMHDWNAVITVREGGFVPACRLLEPFGQVRKTEFFNTLVMRADDPFGLLAELQGQIAGNPDIAAWVSRFMPMQRRFSFQFVAEFELRSQEAVLEWLPRLANSRFHLRMHRRGFKGKFSSADEERFLDEFLLQRLEDAGTPGKVAFDDPDLIIALETIGPQAGLSIFSRDELQHFSLLHLD